MTPFFEMSQTIARPVESVFATSVQLDEFPRWSPRNPWAKKLTPGEIGEGTRFQMGIKGFGKVTNELREFERNKRVLVAPLISMFAGGHRWIFTDLGDGTTRIDHQLEMRPKGIFKLIGPMMRRNGANTVRETAAALKAYLERE
jgi:ligand-binding SRPBCC domain-containing protein